MADRQDTETHRRDAEIVESAERMGFIDRRGRHWFRRCWDCGLGLPSEPVEAAWCHKPDCPQRDES